MSELMIYNATVELTALQPAQVDFILTAMQKQYGAEFNEKYKQNTKVELRTTAARVLAGLCEKSLLLGLQRMRHEKRCPSLGAFRELCEYWKGPNEAWADAITFTKNRKYPITVLTKEALDRIQDVLIDTDDNRDAARNLQSAGFAFREIYQRLVEQAKLSNDFERMYERPDVKQQDMVAIEHKIIPEKNVYDKLSDHQKAIVDMQQQLVADGWDQRSALSEARKLCVREKLNKLDEPALKREVTEKPKPKYHTQFQQLVSRGWSVRDAFKQCKNNGEIAK